MRPVASSAVSPSAQGSTSQSRPTHSVTQRSRPRLMLDAACATCRTSHVTPIRARPVATTALEAPSTATRPTSSPPTWPVPPGPDDASSSATAAVARCSRGSGRSVERTGQRIIDSRRSTERSYRQVPERTTKKGYPARTSLPQRWHGIAVAACSYTTVAARVMSRSPRSDPVLGDQVVVDASSGGVALGDGGDNLS